MQTKTNEVIDFRNEETFYTIKLPTNQMFINAVTDGPKRDTVGRK